MAVILDPDLGPMIQQVRGELIPQGPKVVTGVHITNNYKVLSVLHTRREPGARIGVDPNMSKEHHMVIHRPGHL